MTLRKPAKPSKREQRAATRPKRSVEHDPNLWRDLAAIGRRVPKTIRAEIPRDLARNFDHYHDGTPKQD